LGLEVNKLLYFLIVSVNSALEKSSHLVKGFVEISSRRQRLIYWSWAKLKVLWRASQKSSNSIHGCLLKWIALVAENLQFFNLFYEVPGSFVF